MQATRTAPTRPGYRTPRLSRQQALASVAANVVKLISGFKLPPPDDDDDQ